MKNFRHTEHGRMALVLLFSHLLEEYELVAQAMPWMYVLYLVIIELFQFISGVNLE